MQQRPLRASDGGRFQLERGHNVARAVAALEGIFKFEQAPNLGPRQRWAQTGYRQAGVRQID